MCTEKKQERIPKSDQRVSQFSMQLHATKHQANFRGECHSLHTVNAGQSDLVNVMLEEKFVT